MPTAYAKGRAARPDVPPAEAPEGVQLAPEAERTAGMEGSYGDDFEEFMYGPTDRPEEPVTTGATARKAPPPGDMATWLPRLLEAARDPNAPLELQNFLRLLRHHSGA